MHQTITAGPGAFPLELVLGGKPEPLAAASLDELAERISRAAARRDLFADLASFDPERYTRRVLHRDGRVEVVLACWLPGQRSPAHDHGACRGAGAVVFGELVETRYRAEGDLAVPEREIAVAQQATLLERPGAIHSVANRSRRPAVSLHVYVPALEMRTWSVRG